MSHTPGPWKVDAGGFPILIEGPQGEYVASIEAATAEGDEQGQINAALIAAAPELFKELERLVRLMEPREVAGCLNIPGLATLNGPRAALAKARGRG